jgi:hypothetical protein
MIYGPVRIGKTSTAATWPRPVFLSAGVEKGDTTLRSFPGIDVAQINSVADMQQAVDWISANYKSRGWETVVVDAVTFYADIFITDMMDTKREGKKKEKMEQQDWGMLDTHLQKWLLPRLHKLDVNVVWIALEQEQKDEEGKIISRQPMLYGKTAVKFPAACDLIAYMSMAQIKNTQTGRIEEHRVLRTAPYNGAMAGGRFPPDTFPEGWIWPNYQYIYARLANQLKSETNEQAQAISAAQVPAAAVVAQ